MENCKQNIGIENMKRKYPSLEYVQQDNECIFVGELILNHVYNDVRMTGKFDIEIVVPRDFPLALPTVKELSNCIDDSYTHRYPNGYLCLASNLELKMHISKNHDISVFVDKYVIPYLYTYKYFKEYGTYPYGERSHGTMGDLEYLKDLFCVDNWKQVCNIMMFIIQSNYKGHFLCPCGSEKRIRNCHGGILRDMIEAGLREDCMEIMKKLLEVYRKG